jgi:hypothetical protein
LPLLLIEGQKSQIARIGAQIAREGFLASFVVAILFPARLPRIYFRSRFRGEAAQTGMDTRRPTERNAVDMRGSASAVVNR